VKVLFFSNGNTGVFDEHGQQIPDLQRAWFELFVQFLAAHGHDPATVEFTMPRGERARWLPEYKNWSIEP
jgi:hypothetical protein